MPLPPAEQPETPRSPSIVSPFSRDIGFIERAILEQIPRKCAIPGIRIALIGLGGVGGLQRQAYDRESASSMSEQGDADVIVFRSDLVFDTILKETLLAGYTFYLFPKLSLELRLLI
ncbi:hypothetical protein WAI453_013185 [Rhynchosporium graminicola]